MVVIAVLGQPVPPALAAGKYTLAYWREAGAYENQAPPAGEYGLHSAFVHVWDENGQPLAGNQVYTSWGVLLGTTDGNGCFELILSRPNGYNCQVRDGSHLSDTSPVFSVERAPSWGHYSYEVGFLFKQNATNPGAFDTGNTGIINSSGDAPCEDLHAPHTRSLAFCSTAASNYCSDQYELGQWASSHGQSFVATGNRVVAVKALMAAGYGVSYYWTAQIHEGGPGGPSIGPPRSTRTLVDSEYFSILVKWGINDVQVVPGRTYYLRITRPGGLNVFRVNRDNDPGGNYFENDTAVPGAELMGVVVCATYTNAGPTGTLAGAVRTAEGGPLRGAVVSLPDAALYATTGSDGSYQLPFIPPGSYEVSATQPGYVSGLSHGVMISAGLTATSSFTLTLLTTNAGSGVVTNGGSVLQPFASLPTWNSAFDATWGSAATFDLVAGGQTGSALQARRSGPGSSARVQVLPIRSNTPYAISVWARCPSSSSAYWIECGYRLGNFAAQDFDGNAAAWTLVKKFSDTTANGNGNVWARYSTTVNSGANTQISLGFKTGASSGTGPVCQWDELSVVSLALTPLSAATANTPTNVVLRFAEPVAVLNATNPANYRLLAPSGPVPVWEAVLTDGTNLELRTGWQLPRTNYTLVVSNVTTALQPTNLTGANGQVVVRVPWRLFGVEETTLWKYDPSGTDRGTAWRGLSYADAAWSSGAGLLGVSGGPLPEPIRTPLAVSTNQPTFYFRKTFRLPAWGANAWLRLHPVVDDGAVFWLNNREVLRLGMAGPATFATRAARTVGLAAYEGPFDLPDAGLVTGTNLLAVEVHQADLASPDVVFGVEAEALVLPAQIPAAGALLALARTNGTVSLSWAEPGWALESATNVLGPWSPQSLSSPVVFGVTNEMRFFRLVP